VRDGERGNWAGRVAARARLRAAGRRGQIASPECELLAAADLRQLGAEQRAEFACAQPIGEVVPIAHGHDGPLFVHLTVCETIS
jgi:hypothetical protein